MYLASARGQGCCYGRPISTNKNAIGPFANSRGASEAGAPIDQSTLRVRKGSRILPSSKVHVVACQPQAPRGHSSRRLSSQPGHNPEVLLHTGAWLQAHFTFR